MTPVVSVTLMVTEPGPPPNRLTRMSIELPEPWILSTSSLEQQIQTKFKTNPNQIQTKSKTNPYQIQTKSKLFHLKMLNVSKDIFSSLSSV